MRAGNQECNFDFAGFELPINTSWHSQSLPLTLGEWVAPHGHASVPSITASMLLKEMGITPDLPLEKPICRSRSNS